MVVRRPTILSLYTTMHHWGAFDVTPGNTDPVIVGTGGDHYGTSVTVEQNGTMFEDFSAVQAAVKYQAKRAVLKKEIKWVILGT